MNANRDHDLPIPQRPAAAPATERPVEAARPLKPAISAVILHPRQPRTVLMIQRALHDAGGGFWTPVTGACLPGEPLMECLVREVREEVGLDVRPVQLIWECPTSQRSHLLHWWLSVVTEECASAGLEIVPDSNEVAAWQWVPVAQAGELDPMFDDTRRFFRTFGRILRWPI